MTTRTLDELYAEQTALKERLRENNESISAALKKTLVKCTTSVLGKGCGQALEIGDLEYMQTHYYVRPTGCTGGDYWNESEGLFVCPECGTTNRLYDRPDITRLKHLFKTVINVHND